MDFPTLSLNPTFDLSESREDNVLRSSQEGGYEQTRPRFTRARRNWKLKYIALTQTDKNTLDTFIDNIKGGSEMFNWTDPRSSTVYVVRLEKPIEFGYDERERYTASIALRQV